MRLSSRVWISISGILWAVVGLALLYKGLQIFSHTNPDTARWWLAAALLIGFIKGRFVLSKTVQRISSRILSLPVPIRIADVYPKSYFLLLLSMISLGFLLRLVPLEWRAFIDVAVGSALIHGSFLYFRISKSLTYDTNSRP